MSYNHDFRYPPPGFEQHNQLRLNQQIPVNPNFLSNSQFQRPPGPSRFHPHYVPPPVDFRYESRNCRPPLHNRFVPPTPFDPQVLYANRFSVPPPFNPSRPPPRIPYRQNEPNFRSTYRAPSAPPKNRFSNKPVHRRDRDVDAPLTERDQLLVKWRSNYCETSDDIARKLAEMDPNENKDLWIRSSPADVYYKRCENGDVESTSRLDTLCTLFDQELVARGPKIRENQPPYHIPPPKRKHKVCRHKCKCEKSKLNYILCIKN